ncbi:MAG: FG-GAP repeat domain-containing protein [Rubripirellula sp.]
MQQYGFRVQMVLALLALLPLGCRDQQPSAISPVASTEAVSVQPDEPSSLSEEEKTALISRMRPQVEAFCGDCHVTPRVTSSSKHSWIDEVDQGFMLYQTSGRTDLKVPDRDDVLKYFQCQAPDVLTLPTSIEGYADSPISFTSSSVRLAGTRPPGVTNVRWIDIGMKESPALVYCDIGTGAVKAHWPLLKDAPTQRLATLLQPVHTEPCDLDGDGNIDLVVADIGEFNADDSDLGRVVWLRRKPGTEKYESIVLQDKLSRVADVQPGDFDGDGDLDLLVAVFGWRNSGRIVLLENESSEDALPKFTLREIDSRHGPVHVPPVDLNGDGHLDFVALISQDHEVVDAFLNDGTGQFTKQTIYAAPDPAYGSSGIQLIDMDQDQDLDILFTNGDSFDRGPKPYHSVQWLENEGSYPYSHHHVCQMPGVLNAQAADFDADGDMDIVACSLLAEDVNQAMRTKDTSSVVMLVQTAPGQFTPTKIEGREHHHISLAIGDFNEDDKPDFAVGTFLRTGGDRPDLILWTNRE